MILMKRSHDMKLVALDERYKRTSYSPLWTEDTMLQLCMYSLIDLEGRRDVEIEFLKRSSTNLTWREKIRESQYKMGSWVITALLLMRGTPFFPPPRVSERGEKKLFSAASGIDSEFHTLNFFERHFIRQ